MSRLKNTLFHWRKSILSSNRDHHCRVYTGGKKSDSHGPTKHGLCSPNKTFVYLLIDKDKQNEIVSVCTMIIIMAADVSRGSSKQFKIYRHFIVSLGTVATE